MKTDKDSNIKEEIAVGVLHKILRLQDVIRCVYFLLHFFFKIRVLPKRSKCTQLKSFYLHLEGFLPCRFFLFKKKEKRYLSGSLSEMKR